MRPRHLTSISYVGFYRYLVTTCTHDRHRAFDDADVAGATTGQLLHAFGRFGLAVAAYCFMPDHVHVVAVAESERADLLSAVKRFKQTTGFAYRNSLGRRSWQEGFHERVLRSDESTEAAMRYVLENPVRAGLTRAIGDYPFARSGVYDRKALLDLWG